MLTCHLLPSHSNGTSDLHLGTLGHYPLTCSSLHTLHVPSLWHQSLPFSTGAFSLTSKHALLSPNLASVTHPGIPHGIILDVPETSNPPYQNSRCCAHPSAHPPLVFLILVNSTMIHRVAQARNHLIPSFPHLKHLIHQQVLLICLQNISNPPFSSSSLPPPQSRS